MSANNARIIIHTARPGIVIGKKGEDIELLRKKVSEIMGVPAHINVEEIRKPELDAYLVAEIGGSTVGETNHVQTSNEKSGI